MVHRDDLHSILLKTSSNIPIKIKRFKTDILTVYLTKCTNISIWARNHKEVQDVRIFPSRHIEILSIGHLKVQDVVSYQEEKEIHGELKNMKKREEKMVKYLGAYRYKFGFDDV